MAAPLELGARVLTPQHGTGEIVHVYPAGPWGRRIFGVRIPRRRRALVLYAEELRIAKGGTE